MRIWRLHLTANGNGPASYLSHGLSVHDKQQDDLMVKPIVVVGYSTPNITSRKLCIWLGGIQVNFHADSASFIKRLFFTCRNADGDAAGNPGGTVYYIGSNRQEAIDKFHGLFGPKWPVVMDGVKGYFTAIDYHGGETVTFRIGDVPSAKPLEPRECERYPDYFTRAQLLGVPCTTDGVTNNSIWKNGKWVKREPFREAAIAGDPASPFNYEGDQTLSIAKLYRELKVRNNENDPKDIPELTEEMQKMGEQQIGVAGSKSSGGLSEKDAERIFKRLLAETTKFGV